MSPKASSNPAALVDETVADITPRQALVAELRQTNSFETVSFTRGSLGQALEVLITDIAPVPLKTIDASKLAPLPYEKNLPVDGSINEDVPDNLVMQVGKYVVPVEVLMVKLSDGCQEALVELDLSEICNATKKDSFTLTQLPLSIHTLVEATRIFKQIGDSARANGKGNEWTAYFDPTTGPYLVRTTKHGQTWESFLAVLKQATSDNLQIREPTWKETLFGIF